MTGLDKILAQIRQDADAAAKATLDEAKKQADEILQKAEAEGEAQAKKIAEEGEAQAADVISRANSAAALMKRRALLEEKQKMIDEVINEAKRSLYQLPDKEYFGLLLKMAVRFAQKGEKGQIVFSERDAKRLPTDFMQEINKELTHKGAELTLSPPSAAVDGGFILVYGGIEENCTFEALFESEREMLQDKVHAVLF